MVEYQISLDTGICQEQLAGQLRQVMSIFAHSDIFSSRGKRSIEEHEVCCYVEPVRFIFGASTYENRRDTLNSFKLRNSKTVQGIRVAGAAPGHSPVPDDQINCRHLPVIFSTASARMRKSQFDSFV
jgi:hypothetical protein